VSKIRVAFFALVGVVAATSAVLVLDDCVLRKHVQRSMLTKRSTVTEEDRLWWERYVGPVPGENAEAVNVILPGITGLAFNPTLFHSESAAGESGGSPDPADWEDLKPFEAVDLRDGSGHVRGRLLLSSERAAYRLTELAPLAFFERDLIVQPMDQVDDPIDSDAWTSRPRWARLLGFELLGLLAGLCVGWMVTARESRRFRAISARRAEEKERGVEDGLSDRCPCCGHDLRASGSERCVECGAEVGPPAERARLERADPAWLRRVGLGCSLLSGALHTAAAAIVVHLLCYPLGFAVPQIESMYVEEAIGVLRRVHQWGLAVAALAAILFLIPDPRERHVPRTWSVRRVGRLAAVGYVAISALPLLPQIIPAGGQGAAEIILLVVTPILLALLVFASLRRVRSLAGRLAVGTLERRVARREKVMLIAASAGILVTWAHRGFLQLIWSGVISVGTGNTVLAVLLVVPLLAELALFAALLGVLPALGREWRVAFARAMPQTRRSPTIVPTTERRR
jgi:hypothetical protein